MTRLQETQTVKAALIRAGYPNAKVTHGTGTACAWLRLKVQVPGPVTCRCQWTPIGQCQPCRELWSEHYAALIAIARVASGRNELYEDRINATINFEAQP